MNRSVDERRDVVELGSLRMGAFDDAMRAMPSVTFLRDVLAIIREHYMLYGEFPTAEQICAYLQHPGR